MDYFLNLCFLRWVCFHVEWQDCEWPLWYLYRLRPALPFKVLFLSFFTWAVWPSISHSRALQLYTCARLSFFNNNVLPYAPAPYGVDLLTANMNPCPVLKFLDSFSELLFTVSYSHLWTTLGLGIGQFLKLPFQMIYSLLDLVENLNPQILLTNYYCLFSETHLH